MIIPSSSTRSQSSAPVRTVPLAVLLGASSLLLPLAHAQQEEKASKEFAELKVKAEQGDPNAQSNLGACYGQAKNYAEAVKWYRKAVERDWAPALNNLGSCYLKGEGVAKDVVEAVKWYRKSAVQNYPEAQSNLGHCYAEGLGVPQDDVEAVRWLRKAAEGNYAEAQVVLGTRYYAGRGVPQDITEAIRWWRQAAEQSHVGAWNNLAACYYAGHGVAKDEVQAYKWMLLAGALGSEEAKQNIAALEYKLSRKQLAEGQKLASEFKPPDDSPVPAPPDELDAGALADLRAKAAAGGAKAQNELGEALYAGKLGARKDAVAAVKWFRRAAEQNLPAAQSNLAACYDRGDGVAKYEAEALKWYLLAAKQGDTKAKRNASMLELMLSQAEVAEARRRADQ